MGKGNGMSQQEVYKPHRALTSDGRALYSCVHAPMGCEAPCGECFNATPTLTPTPVDINDLSTTLAAEAARQVEVALRELRRCEKVYDAIKRGDLNALTKRDLRILLEPRVY